MNPFDLRGPAFLGFFIAMSIIGLVVLYLAQRAMIFGEQRRASPEARRHLRDPYLVAFLRAGFRGVIHTMVFSLHERKLLTYAGENLVATGSRESLKAVPHPLELALLLFLSKAHTMAQILEDASLKATVERYAEPLRRGGLIADDEEYARRRPPFLMIAGVLGALSVIKILVALQRGHGNIVFLVIVTVLVLASCYAIYRSQHMNAGRQALQDQQSLFSRLKLRVSRMAVQGATNEAVLVAATFGLDALPKADYPMAAILHHQSKKGSSSCSSGCGSSCGGGGCGGGCGGCGG